MLANNGVQGMAGAEDAVGGHLANITSALGPMAEAISQIPDSRQMLAALQKLGELASAVIGFSTVMGIDPTTITLDMDVVAAPPPIGTAPQERVVPALPESVAASEETAAAKCPPANPQIEQQSPTRKVKLTKREEVMLAYVKEHPGQKIAPRMLVGIIDGADKTKGEVVTHFLKKLEAHPEIAGQLHSEGQASARRVWLDGAESETDIVEPTAVESSAGQHEPIPTEAVSKHGACSPDDRAARFQRMRDYMEERRGQLVTPAELIPLVGGQLTPDGKRRAVTTFFDQLGQLPEYADQLHSKGATLSRRYWLGEQAEPELPNATTEETPVASSAEPESLDANNISIEHLEDEAQPTNTSEPEAQEAHPVLHVGLSAREQPMLAILLARRGQPVAPKELEPALPNDLSYGAKKMAVSAFFKHVAHLPEFADQLHSEGSTKARRYWLGELATEHSDVALPPAVGSPVPSPTGVPQVPAKAETTASHKFEAHTLTDWGLRVTLNGNKQAYIGARPLRLTNIGIDALLVIGQHAEGVSFDALRKALSQQRGHEVDLKLMRKVLDDICSTFGSEYQRFWSDTIVRGDAPDRIIQLKNQTASQGVPPNFLAL